MLSRCLKSLKMLTWREVRSCRASAEKSCIARLSQRRPTTVSGSTMRGDALIDRCSKETVRITPSARSRSRLLTLLSYLARQNPLRFSIKARVSTLSRTTTSICIAFLTTSRLIFTMV
jgi:hypothetical protein